jgi:DnaA N-terminal domain
MDRVKKSVLAWHKLSWIEAIAKDPRITPATLKVAVAISKRADGEGIARTATQDWIAKHVGLGERAVRNCIGRLCSAGYLERLKTGHHDVYGRGRASEFRLIIAALNKSASEPYVSGNFRKRNANSEKAAPPFRNPSTPIPPLPSSIPKNLLRGGPTGASDAVPPSSPFGSVWPAIKTRLVSSPTFGESKVDAWLNDVEVVSIVDGVLTLLASSRFRANYIASNFDRQILDALCEIEPGVRSVRVESPSPIKSADSTPDDDYVDF